MIVPGRRAGPEPETTDGERDPWRERVRHLEAELHQLTAALEDVVALALTTGDSRRRSTKIHRRTVAALSGLDSQAVSRTPNG